MILDRVGQLGIAPTFGLGGVRITTATTDTTNQVIINTSNKEEVWSWSVTAFDGSVVGGNPSGNQLAETGCCRVLLAAQ